MRLIDGAISPDLIAGIVAKGSSKMDARAHSLYIDQVGQENGNGLTLSAIDCSAYEEMVIMEANKIHKFILSEFSEVRSIEILHSKGLVPAGGIFLVAMVTSGNSEQPLKACAKVVELIKEKLPIWKKEIYNSDTDRETKPDVF